MTDPQPEPRDDGEDIGPEPPVHPSGKQDPEAPE